MVRVFGRNVICSSATLSRPVAQAVEAAYASGAEMARALRHGKSACTDEEKPRSEAKTLYVLAFIDDALPPLIKAVPHVPEKAERKGLRPCLHCTTAGCPHSWRP